MDALRVVGGNKLRGDLIVSGSKNASLPIMAATLLSEGTSTLRGTPDLADVRTFSNLLTQLGAEIAQQDHRLKCNAGTVHQVEAEYDLVRTMRASILVLGPLLARFGRARVSLPGGCAIGARPIDQHLKGLQALGANIELQHGYVEASTKGLKGAEIRFDFPTVGGTENIMLAASLAKGVTVIDNAAREPEITDLALVLTQMGVDVQGAGTARLVIHGRKQLQPFDHQVIPDRIEFGTFLVAGAMMGEGLRILGDGLKIKPC